MTADSTAGSTASGPISSRTARLIAIPVAVAVVAVGLWLLGQALDSSLVRFTGLMTSATTLVPLPADTFVLAASKHDPALVIGLVGGFINAYMALVERSWIRILVDHRAFNRFITFFDTNRLVEAASRQIFLWLIISGLTFPFEPFRLLAVLKNYSPVKYWLATFLSRSVRCYFLARLGEALFEVGVLQQALWISLVLFLLALARSAVKLVRHVRSEPEVAAEDSALLHAAGIDAEREPGAGLNDADREPTAGA